MTRMVHLSPLLLSQLITAGCVHYNSPVDRETIPSSTDTVVYGRFSMAAATGSNEGAMGLVMRCYHDNEYIFRFKQTSSVFAVKVEPSASCWVMSVVFSGHGLGFSKRILFPRGILDNMRFDAGKAYYIGDFYANVTISGETGAYGHLWKLEDLHNHYESTTAELIAQYPQLARVPSVNQLHLSAPQLTEP